MPIRYAQKFLNSLQSINQPEYTIIQPHLLTTFYKLDNYSLNGNIVSDLTDHFSQFCIFSSSTEIIQTTKVVTRDHSKFSNSKFLHDISSLNNILEPRPA